MWTYHLKDGLKFEDGTPITTADIKYGIERSFAAELSGGAPYLRDWLIGGKDYQGPYKDKNGLDSIETPDDKTIVFHLNKPEGDFPFLATQTSFAPVPKAKDTGTKYEDHPYSSGPYKVVSNQNDGRHLVLERNTYWDPKTDDERKAYPDRIDVQPGLDGAVINQRLSAGSGKDAAAVTTDTNLTAAELAKITGDKQLAARVGTGQFGYTDYIAFNPKVKPFDYPKVRQAIAYAVDRSTVVNALGGSSLAKPATTFLPDQKAFGYTPYDSFPAGPSGNAAKARELLKEAGYAKGLTITLTHDSSAGDEQGPEVATALQDALKRAGITVKLQGLESSAYSEKIHSVRTEPGFFLTGWGADWPSGGPFLAPIFDGRQIVKDGYDFNASQLNDPAVDKEIDEINELTDLQAAAKRRGALDKKIGEQALTVPLVHPSTSVCSARTSRTSSSATGPVSSTSRRSRSSDGHRPSDGTRRGRGHPAAAPGARQVWRRLRARRAALAGACVIVLLALMALAAPLLAALEGQGPDACHADAVGSALGDVPIGSFGGVGADHWLGLEPGTGRDLFVRLVYGARISLGVGLAATAVQVIVGVGVGLAAGLGNRLLDTLLSRTRDCPSSASA